ncbi:MnhB domain-containing protein [Cystobacter fuscus]
MNDTTRRAVLLVALLGFAGLYVWGLQGLPPSGEYRGLYGKIINQVVVTERHATDAVTAVTFDYRGFDTLGEEFILFASVMGVAVLLRHQVEEEEDAGGERQEQREDESSARAAPDPSAATRVMGLVLVGIIVTFGLYVVTHGQLTPGGGFQGGVILATAPLLVYLAGNPKKFLRIAPPWLVEVGEACGAAGFVLLGLLGLVLGGLYLQNVVPLGPSDPKVTSAGTIPLINLSTGLEVAGGFVLLLSVFLEQVLSRRAGKGRR